MNWTKSSLLSLKSKQVEYLEISTNQSPFILLTPTQSFKQVKQSFQPFTSTLPTAQTVRLMTCSMYERMKLSRKYLSWLLLLSAMAGTWFLHILNASRVGSSCLPSMNVEYCLQVSTHTSRQVDISGLRDRMCRFSHTQLVYSEVVNIYCSSGFSKYFSSRKFWKTFEKYTLLISVDSLRVLMYAAISNTPLFSLSSSQYAVKANCQVAMNSSSGYELLSETWLQQYASNCYYQDGCSSKLRLVLNIFSLNKVREVQSSELGEAMN